MKRAKGHETRARSAKFDTRSMANCPDNGTWRAFHIKEGHYSGGSTQTGWMTGNIGGGRTGSSASCFRAIASTKWHKKGTATHIHAKFDVLPAHVADGRAGHEATGTAKGGQHLANTKGENRGAVVFYNNQKTPISHSHATTIITILMPWDRLAHERRTSQSVQLS